MGRLLLLSLVGFSNPGLFPVPFSGGCNFPHLFTFLKYYIYLYYLCVCRHTYVMVASEIRGQCAGVDFLFYPLGPSD